MGNDNTVYNTADSKRETKIINALRIVNGMYAGNSCIRGCLARVRRPSSNVWRPPEPRRRMGYWTQPGWSVVRTRNHAHIHIERRALYEDAAVLWRTYVAWMQELIHMMICVQYKIYDSQRWYLWFLVRFSTFAVYDIPVCERSDIPRQSITVALRITPSSLKRICWFLVSRFSFQVHKCQIYPYNCKKVDTRLAAVN